MSTSKMRQSLTESWAQIEQPSEDSSFSDASLSESPEPEPSPRRRSARKLHSSQLTTPRRNGLRVSSRSSISPNQYYSPMMSEPIFIMPSPDATPIATRRRRHPSSSTTSTPKSRPVSRRTRKQPSQVQDSASIWNDVIFPPLLFFFKCFLDALSLLRMPISIVIALAIVSVFLTTLVPQWILSNVPGLPSLSTNMRIPSACSLPGAQHFVPFCRPSSSLPKPLSREQQIENEKLLFKKFGEIDHSAERMLEAKPVLSALSAQLLHDQMSIADTMNLIRYQSQLPSKAELVQEFTQYHQLLKQLTYQLTDYSQHVGRSVDKIISAKRFTLHSLEELKSRAGLDGMLDGVWNAILPASYSKITKDQIMDRYLRHAKEVEAVVKTLISEGTTVDLHLQTMDDHVDMMRSTISKDSATMEVRKEELFSQLWTKLGGNLKDRKFVEKNIKIGDRVDTTTRESARHVKLTLLELRRIQASMADIQTRLNEPRTREAMTVQELKEHLEFVEGGLNRLTGKREEQKTRDFEALSALQTFREKDE
ncbi:hypothetical protein BT63DRAFT_429680 [Microthyrium microscopicum]|uniref:Uncharacterized protein n=1 Tax=Microthyrium microscopicum TaxID=703497 RepID=A0A6A6TYT0_9PEZI|nr:hypothetical protein BT63DRAFT_429680 [Microthyrium microscopicum]